MKKRFNVNGLLWLLFVLLVFPCLLGAVKGKRFQRVLVSLRDGEKTAKLELAEIALKRPQNVTETQVAHSSCRDHKDIDLVQ